MPRRGVVVRRVLFAALLIVFCISAYRLGNGWLRRDAEGKAFVTLQQQVAQTENTQPEISPYTSLKTQNADFYGWIKIDDTNINYPVMYTPDDPEKYLHLSFEGEDSYSGTPFLGAGCGEDGANNQIIYAHNMKNGSMFAGLLRYDDAYFSAAHENIQFDTLDGSGTYQVFAAFYSRVYGQNETGVFRYYDYTGALDEIAFTEYVQKCREASLYDTGVPVPAYGDKLLTLSTCSYNVQNERFVVVARKIS